MSRIGIFRHRIRLYGSDLGFRDLTHKRLSASIGLARTYKAYLLAVPQHFPRHLTPIAYKAHSKAHLLQEPFSAWRKDFINLCSEAIPYAEREPPVVCEPRIDVGCSSKLDN